MQEPGITLPSPNCPPRAAMSLYLGVPKEWLSTVSSVSPRSEREITLQRKTALPGQLINHLSPLKGSVGPASHHSKSARVRLWLGYFWEVMLAPYAKWSISSSHTGPSWAGRLVSKPPRRWKRAPPPWAKDLIFVVAGLARAAFLQVELSGLRSFRLSWAG